MLEHEGEFTREFRYSEEIKKEVLAHIKDTSLGSPECQVYLDRMEYDYLRSEISALVDNLTDKDISPREKLHKHSELRIAVQKLATLDMGGLQQKMHP